jgi:Helix-turn-helix domain
LATTSHTLRRLARDGHSPVLVRRIGGRWRFSRADLGRFLDEPMASPQ